MSNIIKIFFSPSKKTKKVVEQVASNIEGNKSSLINATTNAGSDLFLITPGENLVIHADENNFGPENTNLSASSTASATLSPERIGAGNLPVLLKAGPKVRLRDLIRPSEARKRWCFLAQYLMVFLSLLKF